MKSKIEYVKFSYRSTMLTADIDKVFTLLQPTSRMNGKIETRFKYALGCLMATMHQAYEQDVEMSVSSYESNYMYKKGRYNKGEVSANIVRKLLSGLIENGFLIVTKDYSNQPKGRGHTRLYKATKKFYDMVSPPLVNKQHECIRIKTKISGKSSLIEYDDTPFLIRTRQSVNEYDEFMLQFPVKGVNSAKLLINGTIEKCRLNTIAHRSFTDNENRGGRYAYGGISHLSMPRGYREGITIAGHPTVEYDFSALHVNIAYNTLGLTYKGNDPYMDVFGFQDLHLRKVIKKSLLTAFNVGFDRSYRKSRANAVLAIKDALESDYQSEICRGYDAVHFQEILDRFGLTLKALLIKIEEYHKPISKYFYSGEGIIFQNRDSAIMEYIIEAFKFYGIPILSVHDSVIVRQDISSEFVVSILKTAYFQMYRQDITIKSTKEKGKIMDRVQKLVKEFMPYEFVMNYRVGNYWMTKIVSSEYSWSSKNLPQREAV